MPNESSLRQDQGVGSMFVIKLLPFVPFFPPILFSIFHFVKLLVDTTRERVFEHQSGPLSVLTTTCLIGHVSVGL